MPDQYGFNHLGDSVRCIDCPTGGPIWRWPEHKRARHGTHGTEPKPCAADVRRQRILLTAPPTNSNEEKEAITMANKATSKGKPAKQVAIDVLRKAGEPLHANEVAKRLLASGRCAGLKGKTPEATISAMLAVGSKPGGPFARVAKGTYTLADSARASKGTEAKPATTANRSATRKPVTATSKTAKKRTATKRTTAKRTR